MRNMGGLQIDKNIRPNPVTVSSASQKCCRCLLAILYFCVMIGFIFLSAVIRTRSSTKLALAISIVSAIIVVLLICAPVAYLIRQCYRKDSTQTTRGFTLILGMWSAAGLGSFAGLYPLITMFGQPQALLLGVPLSLLACFIAACQRKKLLALDMLPQFYSIEFAIALLFKIPFFIILFFSNENQETVRTADLGLFIATTFWQFLFLTTSTMTFLNILPPPSFAFALLAILIGPFFLRYFFTAFVSLVDWLVVAHGENKIVRMLVPHHFDSINNTEDDLKQVNSNDGNETDTDLTIC